MNFYLLIEMKLDKKYQLKKKPFSFILSKKKKKKRINLTDKC